MSTGIENARSEVIAPRYAEVAIPLHVSHTFQYRLKESMRREAQVGARILVPLGRTKVTGYIVALHENLNRENSVDEADIKEVENVLDLIPVCTPEILEITRWVSDYYGSAWGEVIKAALPPGISPATKVVLSLTDKGRARAETLSDCSKNTPTRLVLLALYRAGEITADSFHGQLSRPQLSRAIRELEREELLQQHRTIPERKVKEKLSKAVRLLTPLDWSSDSRMTSGQERVLSTLDAKAAPLSLKELLQAAHVGPSTVKSLARKGLLEIFEQPVRRDPLFRAELPVINQHELTQDQSAVLAAIQTQLHSASYGAFLLHGVTGSGKTEVYIRAIRTTLKLDRSAIMLVPEIALTPLFSRRLRAEFGDLVAIFHSSLAKGERFDEWMRVKNGEARLVIGTRSAVFAPVKNLGLIIVDEEHESTYRQQDSPHYHGRDTAIVRAQKESATVVLGSATPSLEAFHNSSSGKSTYLSLPRRIGNRSMALAEIIDMRQIFAKHGRPKIFSDELLEAIRANQERKEQAIILLNRRGYSSFVLCRSCGETIQCPNCDVTLTYHRSER
ncbi:MAG TPA: primosomal protein N', partial [Pyrinomonadaceae bacterium]